MFLVMLDDGYAKGAMVACSALKRHGTKHSVVCMVTEDVGQKAMTSLKAVFDEVIPVKLETHRIAFRPNNAYKSWAQHALTKWHCLSLEKFDKVIFLDSDLLPRRNIDELSSFPAPSGIFDWTRLDKRCPPDREKGETVPKSFLDCRKRKHVVTGEVLVLPTGKILHKKFFDWVEERQPLSGWGWKGCNSGSDEVTITEFFREVSQNKSWYFLPGCFASKEWHECCEDSPMISFLGDKPWKWKETGYWSDYDGWWEEAWIASKKYGVGDFLLENQPQKGGNYTNMLWILVMAMSAFIPR